MIVQTPAPESPNPDPPGSPGLGVQSVARLVASAVCGLHRVDGHFVRLTATLGDDGYIDVHATQVNFTDEDPAVRVLLYPTAPVPVASRAVPAPRGAVQPGQRPGAPASI